MTMFVLTIKVKGSMAVQSESTPVIILVEVRSVRSRNLQRKYQVLEMEGICEELDERFVCGKLDKRLM